MLTLPSGIAAHVDDPVYYAAHLIELQGSTPHYWTDYSQDLVWNGHTWLHTLPFRPGQIVTDAEGIQDVSVSFDEQLHQLQGYDSTEGMTDRTMRIHEVWISTADGITVLDVMQDIASGTTAGLDFDETDESSSATLSLGSSAAMNSQNGPRNKYDLNCQNGFGDARCKFASPASTTVAAALGATGSQTVTPASMTGIVVGASMFVADALGTNGEVVVVTAKTGTTFTAVFTMTKAAAWTVRGLCMRTYANCMIYSNTPNFRGCRHALTPPATIQWGGASYILNVRYVSYP